MHPTIIILSAERYTLGPADNADRTKRLEQLLTLYGLSYRQVAGKYRGSTEQSFVVALPSVASVAAEVEEICASLAWGFDQESYLYSHPDRSCELVYQYGRREALVGKLKPVDAAKVAVLDAYTEVAGEYFAVV